MGHNKRDILKNILIYVPSRYFSQFIGFFTSLLMKRFLGPLYAGLWNLLRLVMEYTNHAELGSTLAVYYKIPFFKAKNNNAEADSVKNNVATFVLMCSFCASALISIYALFSYGRLSNELFYGLLAISAVIIIDRVYTLYIILLRANKDYKVLSKSVYFDTILNFSLILLIVTRFRLYGLFFVVIIVPILNILFIRHYVKYSVRFSLDWRKITSYIRFGFPMYMTSVLSMLLKSIDRIMIAGMLGLKYLGFYSIALMARNSSVQLCMNFSHVISPHFMEDFGKYGRGEKLSSYVIKGTFALSCFMSMFLGFVFIYAPPIINIALPAFVAGIPALKIFLLTSLFASLVTLPTDYIVSLGKQSRLISFISIALLMNIFLNYFLIKNGFGISGAATATAISTFFYLITILIYSMRHFTNTTGISKFIFKLFFPCIYASAILLLLDRFVVYHSVWVNTFIKTAIFLLTCSAIVLALEKETGLVRIFSVLIKLKFKKK